MRWHASRQRSGVWQRHDRKRLGASHSNCQSQRVRRLELLGHMEHHELRCNPVTPPGCVKIEEKQAILQVVNCRARVMVGARATVRVSALRSHTVFAGT